MTTSAVQPVLLFSLNNFQNGAGADGSILPSLGITVGLDSNLQPVPISVPLEFCLQTLRGLATVTVAGSDGTVYARTDVQNSANGFQLSNGSSLTTAGAIKLATLTSLSLKVPPSSPLR